MDQEILSESHLQRVALIEKLGFADKEETAFKLRLLVNECIGSIRDAVRDLPNPTRYKTSNESAAVKSPSQRLKDTEQELGELARWFQGGRRPRLRATISDYAIAAMVGLPPFGKKIFAATTHKISPENWENPGDAILYRGDIYFFDVLSEDEEIAKSQIDLYSELRTEKGEPLYLEICRLETEWPASFLRLIATQVQSRVSHLPLADLDTVLKRLDYPLMHSGATQALRIIKYLRKDFDRKSQVTVAKWARREPGFDLIAKMLDEVWPSFKGPPPGNRLGERRSKKPTQRQLLTDLANNLVELVQQKLNSDTQFKDPKFAVVQAPNHFLGSDETFSDQVKEIVTLIIALRTEAISYFVARHTIVGICDAAFENDKGLNSAANRVSESVVGKIDSRLAARQQFLKYGADHLRRHSFKWFGRLDPDSRRHWTGETALAEAIFPVPNLDQDRHLELYSQLVRSLHLDVEESRAWTVLAGWASGAGREYWRVVDIRPKGGFLGMAVPQVK